MKKNITYIISDIDKALAFEWISEAIQKEHFNFNVILLNPGDSTLERFLKDKGIAVDRVKYSGKKHLLSAFWKVRRLFKKYKSEVIHCHLFDACVVGLLAAKSIGIKKRIFTRHHADYHHVYFPRAVYYDKIISYLATDIIAISENVREILIEKENINPSKIHLIHHGFHLDLFSDVSTDRVDNLKEKYHISQNNSPVIGVIARQTHWKGIQYIVPAFQKLLKKYPQAHLILANATGDYKKEINLLLQELPKSAYTEISFEHDLPALYQLFDIYVHTPVDECCEAFGQTYVEALAAKIPSIFTLSGVAREFIRHEKNALVVPFQDSDSIYQSMVSLLENEQLCSMLKENGKEDVFKLFDFDKFANETMKHYV